MVQLVAASDDRALRLVAMRLVAVSKLALRAARGRERARSFVFAKTAT